MEEIDLTPEEYSALITNYPEKHQLYYIWVGILACRGYKIPFTLAELNVKHISNKRYLVNVKKK